MNNNQSKEKIFFYNYFLKKKIQFYLRPVNTRGSNNVKEHKADRENGTYICGFHTYHKFFMKFLQILHGQLPGVHCLILCLKILRLSEFFISFGKFRHRTSPIVLIVSKPKKSEEKRPVGRSRKCHKLELDNKDLHDFNDILKVDQWSVNNT